MSYNIFDVLHKYIAEIYCIDILDGLELFYLSKLFDGIFYYLFDAFVNIGRKLFEVISFKNQYNQVLQARASSRAWISNKILFQIYVKYSFENFFILILFFRYFVSLEKETRR